MFKFRSERVWLCVHLMQACKRCLLCYTLPVPSFSWVLLLQRCSRFHMIAFRVISANPPVSGQPQCFAGGSQHPQLLERVPARAEQEPLSPNVTLLSSLLCKFMQQSAAENLLVSPALAETCHSSISCLR